MTRRRNVILFGGLALALLLFVGLNVLRAARNAAAFPAYWRAEAARPVPAGAIRLVALGDSIMQAIGAARPEEGIAGRVAGYLRARTGRPVHVTNVSIGGATVRAILEEQLPRADLSQADLVIVATATDLEKRLPLEVYRRNLGALLVRLPADRTIFSDLPIEPGRGPYQAEFERLAAEHGIRRADFASVFSHEGRRLDIFSWLFPHLNSKGYAYWFKAFQPEVDRLFDLS